MSYLFIHTYVLAFYVIILHSKAAVLADTSEKYNLCLFCVCANTHSYVYNISHILKLADHIIDKTIILFVTVNFVSG